MVMDSDLIKPTTSIESILPTSSHVNAIRSTHGLCRSIMVARQSGAVVRHVHGRKDEHQTSPANCQNGSGYHMMVG